LCIPHSSLQTRKRRRDIFWTSKNYTWHNMYSWVFLSVKLVHVMILSWPLSWATPSCKSGSKICVRGPVYIGVALQSCSEICGMTWILGLFGPDMDCLRKVVDGREDHLTNDCFSCKFNKNACLFLKLPSLFYEFVS
jgi:hypothetical protein